VDLERNGMRSPAWVTLRAQVIDRVCEALPGATELYLAADGGLQCVPWDALELADGRLVGECLRIRLVTSLTEPSETLAPRASQPPRLLLCGGIDYGTAAMMDGAAGARAHAFAPLPATGDEIASVAAVFARVAPAGEVVTLAARAPEKTRVLNALRGCSHVHMATHGYFAPALMATAAASPVRGVAEETVARLAPQVLCGLALAGANAEPDSSGRHPGIATAEELAAVDLSGF
jgi:hypothetical protein